MEEYGERHDVTYEVTISVPEENDGDPDPSEIATAIYKGVRDIDSLDAVWVARL